MSEPIVLVILDGWGIAPANRGNAITLAKTPCFDRLWNAYPHTQLAASGEAVGLPRHEDGNSETGHLNLGAGSIVFQDLPRINMSIAEASFFEIPAFKAAINHSRQNHSRLHLMGLLGSGGVHSNLEHLIALVQLAKREKVKNLFLHLFTDGRDSPPTSSQTFIGRVDAELKKAGLGQIATLMGRYWAMDRDYRWERTQKAYEALVLGKGVKTTSLHQAIQQSYHQNKTDEFIEPLILTDSQQAPVGLIQDHDAVIFFNFRIDRPRQLTKAFVLPDFETLKPKKASFDPYAERYGLKIYQAPRETTTFQRAKKLKDLFFVTMTEYEQNLPCQVAFPPQPVKMPLARVLAENDCQQFHLAETEKERFVTYYFDGLREKPFPGEDRVEVASPNVKTYDLKPEMSALTVTEELIKALNSNSYDFLLVNYANPDMVGHTGVLSAGIKACEVVDQCLDKVVKTIKNLNAICLITADHGNVEEMINLENNQVNTEHSTNPVPLILVGHHFENQPILRPGVLADVAPTILALMNLEKPSLMMGGNLLQT